MGAVLNRMIISQRSIIERIQETGAQVSTSAAELTATIRQQEEAMGLQVSLTRQVLEAVEAISGVEKKIGNNQCSMWWQHRRKRQILCKQRADESHPDRGSGALNGEANP